MPIEGLSNRRRLPRAGIIRLGIMVNKNGSKYPKETNYFVCPPLVQEVYGKEPKELLIMFPLEDDLVFFKQDLKCYGNRILICKGDGRKAKFWDFDSGDFKQKDCPCEKLENKKCAPTGILQFLLPEVKESVGVWQVSTRSKNSIIDINSGIDFVRGVAGRAAMIPLLLRREPLEIHRAEGKSLKKSTHFTMKLSLGMSLIEIQQLAQRSPTRALLPEKPDESYEAVEDLFPNGKKPDEEEFTEEEEKPEEKPKTQAVKKPEKDSPGALAEELDQIVAEYGDLGGMIPEAQKERLAQLSTRQEYKNKIAFYQDRIDQLRAEDEAERQPSLE